MSSKPLQPQDKYVLRLPDGMRDRLKSHAERSGRSLNSEIIQRLASSLNLNSLTDVDSDFDEDLTVALVNAASMNQRPVKEEIVHRLKQSLTPEITIVNELERQAWDARRKYDDLMDLFIQLTPEERRILEERAEVTKKSHKEYIDSKFIGELTKLKPIGKSGRIVLTAPSRRHMLPDFSGR